MIKNIIFDIGHVILNFNISKVLSFFTNNSEEQKFILNNIINSPEWIQYGLIDTGYIVREDAIKIVQDRTNHINDDLIYRFWTHYSDYASVNKDVLNLIKKLKNNGYNIYLLSNIDSHIYEFIKPSGLFDIVDGYVLSYIEHMIKPFESIYNTLLNRYNLNSNECLFIDDKEDNIKTGNRLGILGMRLKPDDYESIVNLLKEYDIDF